MELAFHQPRCEVRAGAAAGAGTTPLASLAEAGQHMPIVVVTRARRTSWWTAHKRSLFARLQRDRVAAVILRVADDAPRAPVRPDACTRSVDHRSLVARVNG